MKTWVFLLRCLFCTEAEMRTCLQTAGRGLFNTLKIGIDCPSLSYIVQISSSEYAWCECCQVVGWMPVLNLRLTTKADFEPRFHLVVSGKRDSPMRWGVHCLCLLPAVLSERTAGCWGAEEMCLWCLNGWMFFRSIPQKSNSPNTAIYKFLICILLLWLWLH